MMRPGACRDGFGALAPLFAGSALVAVLLGCEKKAEPSKPASGIPSATAARGIGPRSCQNVDVCIEWQKLDAEELLAAKQDCNDSDGKFGSAGCSKDRAVASCGHETGGAVVYLYPSPALDLMAAENECKKTQGMFLRLKPPSAIGASTDGGH